MAIDNPVTEADLTVRKRRVPARGGGKSLRAAILRLNWPFWILLAVVLVVWELVARAQDNSLIVVPPTEIVDRGIEMARSGELWPNVWTSALEFGLGFVFGAIAGIVIGLAGVYFKLSGRAPDPFVVAFYAVPIIALAPI